MAVLPIVEWPAKVLETKAKEVTEFDAKLQQFVQDMHETMDKAQGIGLAANQVGSLQRVLTIFIPYHEPNTEESENKEREPDVREWWHDKRFAFVNPVIEKKSGKARYMEGCLSFPEVYDYVDRADIVTIKAKDEFGKEFTVEANGLFSICLQHEIDHIDGIVFINRMSRLKAQMIKKKINKRQLLSSHESE
ncbi:MAG: peptide deformylase [Oligoflexales bacterium]|nr:peptide deformylase [Oligoflexales bacterium]